MEVCGISDLQTTSVGAASTNSDSLLHNERRQCKSIGTRREGALSAGTSEAEIQPSSKSRNYDMPSFLLSVKPPTRSRTPKGIVLQISDIPEWLNPSTISSRGLLTLLRMHLGSRRKSAVFLRGRMDMYCVGENI